MTIRLTPEDEKVVEERLKSGPFASVDEVIHDALASQSAEATRLLQNKEALNEKIARGLAQLDRGEGIPGDEARARLQERKAAWLAEQNRS